MNLGESPGKALKSCRTTPNVVADVVREAILNGTLRDGQQLRQGEIAAQFGVSRIPVREALRRLEAQGLVTFYPNRGAVVTQLAPQEVREITEIRVLLECRALHLAMPNLSPGWLKKAEAALDLTDAEEDGAKLSSLNIEFHTTLYTPAGRPYLLLLINNLHANVDRYMRICLYTLEHKEISQQEHRRILEACRAGDGETAVTVLQKHIETGATMVVEHLEREREAGAARGEVSKGGTTGV